MTDTRFQSTETVLAPGAWRPRRDAHLARTALLVEQRRQRAAEGVREPVEDFLFTYYPFRLSALQRWTPGAQVALSAADELLTDIRFTLGADGLVRIKPPTAAERERLIFARDLGVAVASRPAFLGCFGLHEWAMVYRQAEARRHQQWPLRLGPAGTDAVVQSMPLRCTHYDAYRFFTPEARPLNRQAPDLAGRLGNEQPGCVHVTMDLYKWAMKSAPWVSAELAADCFELAREARTVDMRASPYDFSSVGLIPICIETPPGRAEYELAQRLLAKKAEPLRARLLAALNAALSE